MASRSPTDTHPVRLPQLNFEQSLDVAFLISDNLQAARKGVVSEERLLEQLRGRQTARAAKDAK